MKSLLVFICLGMCGFIFPVLGFAMFLVFNSGIAGVFDNIGFLTTPLLRISPMNIGYIMAIVSLLFRPPHHSEGRPRRITSIAVVLWALTFMIFISRLFEYESLDFKNILYEMISCLIWAPLFMAFRRMTPTQVAQCKKIIIFCSALTALLTIIIVTTNNTSLYDKLSIYRASSAEREKPLEVSANARITLPGTWTIMPFAIWFCLAEIFVKKKRPRFDGLFYRIAVGLIFTAILLNVTRGLLLSTIFGFALAAFIFAIFMPGRIPLTKIATFTILFIGIAAIARMSFEGLYAAWMDRMGSLIGLGTTDASLGIRLDTNAYMLDVLFREMPFLGHKSGWIYRPDVVPGDPHTFVTIWWNYGLIAAILFIFLMILIFIKLSSILIKRRYYPPEVLIEVIFLVGCYLQFHVTMFSGDYMSEATIFPLMFFISEVDRLWAQRLESTYTV